MKKPSWSLSNYYCPSVPVIAKFFMFLFAAVQSSVTADARSSDKIQTLGENSTDEPYPVCTNVIYTENFFYDQNDDSGNSYYGISVTSDFISSCLLGNPQQIFYDGIVNSSKQIQDGLCNGSLLISPPPILVKTPLWSDVNVTYRYDPNRFCGHAVIFSFYSNSSVNQSNQYLVDCVKNVLSSPVIKLKDVQSTCYTRTSGILLACFGLICLGCFYKFRENLSSAAKQALQSLSLCCSKENQEDAYQRSLVYHSMGQR